MNLAKYSVGIGDRFGHQGCAQLQALLQARERGAEVTPVWNKSFREYSIIGTTQSKYRQEADAAVRAKGWKAPYHVDADHISLKNVEGFLPHCDFYTLDVADFIGQPPSEADLRGFVDRCKKYVGKLRLPGIDKGFEITADMPGAIGRRYLLAVKEAGRIYRHIEKSRGKGNFITEVSMDETIEPQTPAEMFFILEAIAEEKIPAQTIAPKFTGRFNKGVDYVGDVDGFAREFEQDLAVIARAVEEFGLPADLKLSIHSGSDKFSLYGPIHRLIRKYDAGLHVKTAGTTWLEEVAGLAKAGGDGLKLAKEIYGQARGRFDELCKPYATVIDIDTGKLPDPSTVQKWSSEEYVAALRHVPGCRQFNPHFRQLLHVGYKVAAEMGTTFIRALEANPSTIGPLVTDNLYANHILPIFIGR
jgi:hypothetical protein